MPKKKETWAQAFWKSATWVVQIFMIGYLLGFGFTLGFNLALEIL